MSQERSAMIDKYLLGEMNESELEHLEREMLADNALFYDVAERENELIDSFVRGTKDDTVAIDFRSSLVKFPARNAKIRNARLLQTHIEESRTLVSSDAAPIPWYRRLGFAFQAPALAAAALGLILVGTVGFLIVQNRNLNRQVAALNSNGRELNQLRQREAELQAEIEAARSAGGDLTSDLESERERRTALEAELAELRSKINATKPANDSPIVPTIATLILRPVGVRGGPDNVRRLQLVNDEKRVALKIILPTERSEGTFSVRVNDISTATGIKPIKEPGGTSSLTATVPAESFRNGLNRVEIFDSNSQNVVSFAVLTQRGPVN